MNAIIKRVDIIFENCEFCRLLPHMFKNLAMYNVTKSYWINCFQYEKGEANVHLDCRKFFITIKPSGLKTKTEMGGITDTSLKKRLLSWNDITHVQIYFENGTNEYIGVPWKGKDNNEFQKVEIDGKSLAIEISN